MFESLGAWGLSGVPLEIQCNTYLSELEVYIDSDFREFLNIQAIEIIMDDGKDLVFLGLIESAKLSSNYYFDVDGSNCVKARLNERKLLHSKCELRPRLKIKFKEKRNVSVIRIFNRQGDCGLRSRFIALEGMNDGELGFSYKKCP